MHSVEAPIDFRSLTYRVFQHPAAGADGSGRVVAMTSSVRGEGVTYVAHLLCRELAGDKLGRTFYCSADALAYAPLETGAHYEYALTGAGYWTLGERAEQARSAWDFNPSVRCARLETLRCEFDYTIVDCPAICGSSAVASLASLTDAVLLVVGAGKSTRSQMLYAQRVIADSGGWLQGCILNRRTYPIPAMAYRVLKGGGR